jgi:hypothetical protein
VKRIILIIVLIAAVIGGGVWIKKRTDVSKPAAEAAAPEEEQGSHISLDANGNVVIEMSDETQGDAGIIVTNPIAAQLAPELKGYGRVLDPAPLAALMMELASAQVAWTASSNEFARLKFLAAQGNASARALQAAEAAAQRDSLTAQSARDRLVLVAGKAVAEQKDLPGFIQSLASLDAVLVRIDLPAGQTLESAPAGARIVTLSDKSADAEFIGAASSIDPQTQGWGFIFLIRPNSLRVLPGAAVTGHLKISGDPLAGVIVPREAVVRAEGKGWIYILNADGESFTRKEIALDHPVSTGWFVAKGVAAGDHVVVTGAQTLLSEELKASIKAD